MVQAVHLITVILQSKLAETHLLTGKKQMGLILKKTGAIIPVICQSIVSNTSKGSDKSTLTLISNLVSFFCMSDEFECPHSFTRNDCINRSLSGILHFNLTIVFFKYDIV